MPGLIAAVVAAFVGLGLLVRVLTGDAAAVSSSLDVSRMIADLTVQSDLYRSILTVCSRRSSGVAASGDGHPRGWPAPAGGVAAAAELECQDGRRVSEYSLPSAPAGFSAWLYRRDASAICVTADPLIRSEETDLAVAETVRRLGAGQSRTAAGGRLVLVLTSRATPLPAGAACS